MLSLINLVPLEVITNSSAETDKKNKFTYCP